MLAQELLGTWHLRSAIGHDNDGNVFYPMGKDTSGQIVYTTDGYVAVNISANGRPQRSNPETLWVAVSDDEVAPAARGYCAYSGRYVIDVYGTSAKIDGVNQLDVNDPLVRRVRVAQHRGRMRIVVDLKTSQPPAYVVEQRGGTISLELGAARITKATAPRKK